MWPDARRPEARRVFPDDGEHAGGGRAAAAALRRKGVDFIKVHNAVRPAVFFEIVRAASPEALIRWFEEEARRPPTETNALMPLKKAADGSDRQ
ncbi:MAG: hypothetical protein HY302_05220 [Opitutae bacterium]|nr:hypothetical protein [Opitutae bacterium]